MPGRYDGEGSTVSPSAYSPVGSALLHSFTVAPPTDWTTNLTGGDSPELERRQAEWERQIESLDQKEAELHQTQLRLVRDQTATFIRDLQLLRQDFAALKATHEERHGDLREVLEKERRERHSVHVALHDKVLGLEGLLPDQREDVGRLQAQIQAVEASISPHVRELKLSVQREADERHGNHMRLERRLAEVSDGVGRHQQLHEEVDRKLEHQKALADQERDLAHGKLKELIGQHSEMFSKVHGAVSQHRADLELQHSSISDRVERLEKEFQSQLLRKTEKLEADVRELQHALAAERRAGDSHKEQLADHASRLDAHKTSVQERLEYLEKILGDSALEAQAARSKLDKLASQHGKVAQQNAHHASVVDRVKFLEQAFGDSVDRHEKELLQTKTRLEQLHGKLGDHHNQLMNHSSLTDRIEFVEKLLGESADKHAEELAVAHTKLEQLHGRLAACERHGPSLHELQKAHSNLSVDTAAKHAQHASMAERLEYLERTLGDSADRHAAELELLKASAAKQEVVHSKQARDIENLKTAAAQHVALPEKLNSIERAVTESTDRHESAISAAHAKLDQMQGRLATCEVSGSAVSDLKKAHAGLSAEKSALESHHATLKDRVDYLERMMGDSADQHAKALEVAHAKLEQVHGRVVMCERLGNVVGELQKSHGALSAEKASLYGHHATLQERVDFLEQRLGDSADHHARELDNLRAAHAKHADEVKGVKAAHAAQSSMEDRLAYVEKLLGQAADAHVEEVTAVHTKVDALTQRVVVCERTGAALGELKRAHSAVAVEKTTLEQSHGALRERVDRLEEALGEHADKTTRSLEETRSKMDLAHTRLANAERQSGGLADLQKEHEENKMKADTHHTSIRERVDYLERAFGDSVDRHTKELDALKSAHSKLASDARAHQGRSTESAAEAKEHADVHHASVQERLTYLESLLHDSADQHERHAKAAEAHKATVAKLAGEVKQRDSQHTALHERLASAERQISAAAEKHTQEVDAAHTKIEQLQARVSEERAAREAHAAAIENIKKTHGTLSNENSLREQHHATLGERVDYLEKRFGESADKHLREIEAMKAAHAKLQNDAKARETQHAGVTERLSQLAREKDDVVVHQASLKERVDYLERLVGDSADKHEKEMQALKNIHGSHVKEVDSMKKAQAHHASFEERLQYLERKIDDSADRHAQEVAAAHAKADQLHTKLSEERAARERSHGLIADQVKQELRTKDVHSSVQERLQFLESLLGDSADKHARDLDAHKVQHAKLANEVKAKEAHHASLAERVAYLESAIHDSADKHGQELAAAQTKISQLHSRVAEERAARDAHHNASRDGLVKEKETREQQLNDLRQRIHNLEGLIGDHADRHSKELEAHKSASTRLVGELKGQSNVHSSIGDRLERLERLLSDAAREHAGALEHAHGKLEQMHSRLTACERHAAAVGELQKAHGTLISSKSEMDVHHSTLKERVEYLEGIVGDTSEQHRRMVESLKVETSKLSTETRSRDVHHATMAERLSYLEKLLHDSADKHAQELAKAHAKVDELHGRLAACEGQSQMVDSLKKNHSSLIVEKASSSAHVAATTEKVNFLEQSLKDHQDRHAQELRNAHSKIDQLQRHAQAEREAQDGHAKSVSEQFGKEQQVREQRHTSIEERLSYLESYLGESKDRHARDLQQHHGNIQNRLKALEHKVNEEIVELREMVGSERHLRAQHHDALTHHLENERQARASHERSVQQHLEGEKKARENHEKIVSDQFTHEKTIRDRHHQNVQEIIGREKEVRDKHLSAHQELVLRESGTREAALREVHETIGKERAHREQHHQIHSELLQREKSSRQRIEDLLEQESAERNRHHETVNERVNALQSTVNIFDTLIRKEIEERSKENRRIWDAIDNHTHDVSALEEATERTASPKVTRLPSASAAAMAASASSLGAFRQMPSMEVKPCTPSPKAATRVPMSAPVPGYPGAPLPSVRPPQSHIAEPPLFAGALAHAAPVHTFTTTAVAPPVMVQPAQRFTQVPLGPPAHLVQPRQAAMVASAPAGLSMFDQLDVNHDGSISRAEFNQFMSGSRGRP